MTLSSLQGESQVNVFHLLVEIGLLPFYKHGFLKLRLVVTYATSIIIETDRTRQKWMVVE